MSRLATFSLVQHCSVLEAVNTPLSANEAVNTHKLLKMSTLICCWSCQHSCAGSCSCQHSCVCSWSFQHSSSVEPDRTTVPTHEVVSTPVSAHETVNTPVSAHEAVSIHRLLKLSALIFCWTWQHYCAYSCSCQHSSAFEAVNTPVSVHEAVDTPLSAHETANPSLSAGEAESHFVAFSCAWVRHWILGAQRLIMWLEFEFSLSNIVCGT
jgi:hypothetical protein